MDVVAPDAVTVTVTGPGQEDSAAAAPVSCPATALELAAPVSCPATEDSWLTTGETVTNWVWVEVDSMVVVGSSPGPMFTAMDPGADVTLASAPVASAVETEERVT